MRIENYNMTRKEAERLGLRPGRKFEHYFINNANGKPEHRRTGLVEELHKFFFVARVKGKMGRIIQNVSFTICSETRIGAKDFILKNKAP